MRSNNGTNPRVPTPFRVFGVTMLVALSSFAAWRIAGRGGAVSKPEMLDQARVRTAIHRMQHDRLWSEARERFDRLEAKHGLVEPRGIPDRPEPAPLPVVIPTKSTGRAAPLAVSLASPNRRANNPVADSAAACQSEVSLAAIGDNVVISWNDGQGWTLGGAAVQGVGISTDGGLQWTDTGVPPVAPGWAQFRWRGDPIVTADEKQGNFYVFGLGELDRDEPFPAPADTSGLLMARGHFNGGVFVWDDVRIARMENGLVHQLDKESACADSSSGRLYLAYAEFDKSPPTVRIRFVRSNNEGFNWSTPITLSSAADEGDVMDPCVAVGPNGEVYALWQHFDEATALHQYRFRVSTDGGLTFGFQQTAATYCANEGVGAPGFNRLRAAIAPSMAVDRTHGQYRGRVYVSFSASYDYTGDTWVAQPPASTVRFESEPNDGPASADAFTVGQTLRGDADTGSDEDWFRCSLLAGRNVIVWEDSLGPLHNCGVQVFAADGIERLAYGLSHASAGGDLMFMFTAPYDGDYYLRVLYSVYRIRTKYASRSGLPGRDRRDAFVVWSQGGTGGFSSPVRVSDGPLGSDDFVPVLAVGSDGCPYLTWYDERLDPQGARTHLFLSRSNNGGATWLASQRISDSDGSFTTCATNMIPNMGDYMAIASSDSRVIAGWGDARGVDIDTWTQAVPTGVTLSPSPSDATVPAGSSYPVVVNVTNTSPFFADQVSYSISDDQGWVSPVSSYLNLSPAQNQPLGLTVNVPPGAPAGTASRVCITATTGTGAGERECCFDVTATAPVAVEPREVALQLAAVVPNPVRSRATLGFALPSPGAVRLEIFDVAGARVRTLAAGVLPAGRHARTWDGRNDDGGIVAPGAYTCRLLVDGRQLQRRFVVVR